MTNELGWHRRRSADRAAALDQEITSSGTAWRGINLCDADAVKAALQAMDLGFGGGAFDPRLIDVVTTDIAAFARRSTHTAGAGITALGVMLLDDAVWRFAIDRHSTYTSLIESVTGRFLLQPDTSNWKHPS